MKVRKQKVLMPFRILALSGCVTAGVEIVFNLISGADVAESIIPHTSTVSIWINGLSLIIGIIFIFNPHWFLLLYSILFVQSLFLVFIGFEAVGIFMYVFLNMLLFCKGFFKTYFRLKIAFSFGIWGLVLFSLISFGWNRVCFGAVISIFVFCIYMCIYYLLKDEISYFLPGINISKTESACVLPEKGSSLCLQELGLTERQCGCIKACLKGSESYKEIGERYCVSESAIKKEMADLFRFFGVKNREMLRILLSQYKIDLSEQLQNV